LKITGAEEIIIAAPSVSAITEAFTILITAVSSFRLPSHFNEFTVTLWRLFQNVHFRDVVIRFILLDPVEEVPALCCNFVHGEAKIAVDFSVFGQLFPIRWRGFDFGLIFSKDELLLLIV